MLAAFLLVGTSWFLYSRLFADKDALVVYCAHDAVYSEEVFRRFTEETGIRVRVKQDTEATKSLGLVELLVREKEEPRCDVFWNNEQLGMEQLHEEGVLEPWKGSGFDRIPEKFREPEGHWVGFGARARVYILNDDNLAPGETPETILRREDLSRTAIANPLYGTTLTHYSVLWQRGGAEFLKAWHGKLRDQGMREVNGNGITKNLVAEGVCDLGFTDTDDFFLAKDAGASVSMQPVRIGDERATICIPNTVGIIKGTLKRKQARQLVDYLLSAENEVALANSSSRQIPLGAEVDSEQLPEEVRAMVSWVDDGVSLHGLREARRACIEWLKGLEEDR